MSGLGGVLLTGGGSARLGVDKAGLVLGGETLADRALRQLASVCDLVVEVGAGWTLAPATREEPPGSGPLAALVAGADALVGSGHAGAVVLLACDLPQVEPVLAALAQARTDATTIPVDEQGRRQYVCARYSPVALTVARAAVTSGVRALHRFVSTLDPADIVELSGFALGTFADIDLADDARRAGIDLPR